MKSIAILFTGQIRNNELGDNLITNKSIVNSYNKFIFTERFKKEFTCDIFISTDNINLNKANKYFGTALKNIHLHNNNYYKKIPQKILKDEQYYYNRIGIKIDEDGISNKPWTVRQYYKLYDCYNLLEDYKNPNSYDYIARIRLDSIIMKDICEVINDNFSDPKLQYIGSWDKYSIGKPEIMKAYLTTVEKNYGMYNPAKRNIIFVKNIVPYCEYANWQKKTPWRYAAEVQSFETLYDYCQKNNFNPDEIIKAVGFEMVSEDSKINNKPIIKTFMPNISSKKNNLLLLKLYINRNNTYIPSKSNQHVPQKIVNKNTNLKPRNINTKVININLLLIKNRKKY